MKTRICACLVAALAVILLPATLQLAFAGSDSASSSQLQILDKDGHVTGFVPLRHTEIKTEISGFVARITVTQEFENVLPTAVEAVYVFPLPQESAVDGMTMVVGDRQIKAVIHERDEARKIFEQARTSGHTAALLDQERPNIFTQSVTNIPPNSRVEVTLSVIELLKYEAGSYEFAFPLVVGPRYMPGSATGAATQGTMPDTNQVPDASKISPPVAGVHTDDAHAGHDVSIDVELAAGVYVTDVHSDSHTIVAERTGPDAFHVRLADNAVLPNKDFILKYKVAGEGIGDAILTHSDSKGGYFTLILQPPDRVPDSEVVPRELIFVVDTSGSMWGFPLDMAKKTIQRALDNLRPDETFNLITFSGDTRILFPGPVPATAANIAAAKKVLAGAYGSGGTEMMSAIRTALGDDVKPAKQRAGVQRVRVVCFMTDGYVGNDAEIVSEVQKHPEARVFAFGIGTAVNRFLLSRMAEEGHGEVEFVTNPDQAEPAADRFYERVHSPVLTNISIEWHGLSVQEVYPAQVRDLFAARPIIITGRYTEAASGTVVIRGTRAGGPFVREIPVDLPASHPGHAVLEKIWARRKVDDLMSQDWLGVQNGNSTHKAEIIQVGLTHSLATQYTSFVAVETRRVVQTGDPLRVEVPTELPEGVSRRAVPGSPAGTEVVEVTADAPLIATSPSQVSNTFGGMTLQKFASVQENEGLDRLALFAPGIAGAYRHKARNVGVVHSGDHNQNSKLGPGLAQAYRCAIGGASASRVTLCKGVSSGPIKVKVELISTGPEIVKKLALAGLKVQSGEASTMVVGMIDAAKLQQLAAIAEVKLVTMEK